MKINFFIDHKKYPEASTKMYSWLQQQAMGSNPASNLELIMLLITFSLPLLHLSVLPVEIPQDVTIINDKNHIRSSEPCLPTDISLLVALGNVPTSQTSYYRSPQWVRHSGQLQSLLISDYRPPLIRKMEKKLRCFLD